MNAQSSPSDSLVFECDFEEPPEKVWRALTEPRLLDAWLRAEEPAPPASAEEHPAPRQPQRGEYEILTAEPHRRLSYLWRDREGGVGNSGEREVHSIVTVELAPAVTGGTHLRLTHGEFRIASVAPAMTAARVRPIMSARRRTRVLSIARQSSWRRAA